MPRASKVGRNRKGFDLNDFSWGKIGYMLLLYMFCAVVAGTQLSSQHKEETDKPAYGWLQSYDIGNSIAVQISPPENFERISAADGSFEFWLRHLPLKPSSEPVLLYNGRPKKNQNAHYAIIDIDIGRSNLQQCADFVIRARADYLYSKGELSAITFKFTNGQPCPFINWLNGERPVVSNDIVSWIKINHPDSSYASFREYLDSVFMYAGSLSLSKELRRVENVRDMSVGDVFVQGGLPGHAAIVVDMALHVESMQKVFLLAEGYTPAQDIKILKNPNDNALSPWYPLDFGDTLHTLEWTFYSNQLMRF